MAMTETELSKTAGLCSQKPGSSPTCPSLEAQNFHHGILQDVFFGVLNTLLIKFVNTVFLLHIPLQGKSGTCALGVTIIFQQRRCSKPRDFCFTSKVSEKIIQSSEKKLSTDNFSVNGVLLFIHPQSTQAPKLLT